MELYYWKCEIVNIYENQLGSESVGNRRRHLDMRSIYARCGADATVNRTGERWRARKAAPMHRDATRATEFDLRKLSATCFSLPVDSDSAGRSLS